MVCMFIVSLIKKDNSIVDTAYGIGFLLITYSTLYYYGTLSLPQIVVTLLITIWALRLSYRIYRRNHGKPEDFRYKKWRETWKWFRLRSFFQIYMLQGGIIVAIASVAMIVNSSVYTGAIWFVILGAIVWSIGFYFEARGDYELDQFIKNPENKGKLMTEGLWMYTRHPNYFGETVMWWGLWIIGLSVVGGSFAIISPLLITFLLLKVSGIPMLEAKYIGNTDYDAYKLRTNAFIPWKPRTLL
ncbi:MAG: DUF1295 domain-containing protein [Candidatus Taylorbacteria bacterium]|nr:DUF1295 domain-containing protein [Candidatus Taylorbacteria bacterium]